MAMDIKLFMDPGDKDKYHIYRHKKDFLKFKGVFDFEGLYRLMAKWFMDRQYDFYEKLFKNKPPELEIEWVAKRKVDELYQFKIRLYFHLWDVKEVEAIKEGVKKKLTSCRMIIEFDPSVIIDYQDRWSESKFTQSLLKFYVLNVVKREVELKYADPLWYINYRLHNLVKEYLDMEVKGNAYADMWR